MSTFRHSFCDPFKPNVIELGDVDQEQIISRFEQIAWDEIIASMSKAKESEIHFSPSIEFENKATKHGVSISGVGTTYLEEFYVFYKRPKRIKKLFGLVAQEHPNYVTDVTGRTKEDVLKTLEAFIAGDYDYLDKEIR